MPRGFLVKRSGCHPHTYLEARPRQCVDIAHRTITLDKDSQHNPVSESTRIFSYSRRTEVEQHESYTVTSIPSVVFSGLAEEQDEPLELTTVRRSPTKETPLLDQLPATPPQPIKTTQPPHLYPTPKKRTLSTSPDTERKTKPLRKGKFARNLNFDDNKTSPVSGMFILDLDSDEEMTGSVKQGDIDPSLNLVSVSEEAKAELAKIDNKLGAYTCQLCKDEFVDAFCLAQHRCSRIVHVEYRCPDCDKVFNCPANLASHRRWHKPRQATVTTSTNFPATQTKPSSTENSAAPSSDPPVLESGAGEIGEGEKFECEVCGKKFKRQTYLKKHVQTHNKVMENSDIDYFCQCGKGFRSLADRSKHNLIHPGMLSSLQDPHLGDIFYPCKFCPSIFYSPGSLSHHLTTYHPVESRRLLLQQLPNITPQFSA
ncbi:insulinoma-associated protein 1a-like [Tachypleus tridentatus]|uniref:insulinoma-associated protein 1a-like n=1 Tax=Tachypleus tridentatus TaxID=6853 RepID=UPI003FD51EE1